MHFVSRAIEPVVLEAAKSFPSVVITGPRRTGKTTLLRHLFPEAEYVLLEDPDIQARVRADPRTMLDELRPPVVFDEIQNTPELLDYIRTRIDRSPRATGQWFFTGSQEAPLMQGVTESMAGRAAILQLLPLSRAESSRASPFLGGYPEVLSRPLARNLWFSSYVQTYLERDVRSVTNVRDLATFRRFLSLVAARHGQMLNKTDLAAPLGVSQPTVSEWLHVLEITGQIVLVAPYLVNFGKRIIKTPKLYIVDSGLACHLLGITTQSELERSPFLGPVFEGFVAAEILKSQINQGKRKELYYFRDHQGLEVDFLFPGKHGELWMVEAKASRTVKPAMAAPLQSLRRSIGDQTSVRLTIVHSESPSAPRTRAVSPGVEALDVPAFVEALRPAPRRTRSLTQAVQRA
ncbi:MAG: ATP-binding protein [Bryobacteraceae bacterium]|nr:ATP-binding protein [Bryobacteraceae bacterium]